LFDCNVDAPFVVRSAHARAIVDGGRSWHTHPEVLTTVCVTRSAVALEQCKDDLILLWEDQWLTVEESFTLQPIVLVNSIRTDIRRVKEDDDQYDRWNPLGGLQEDIDVFFLVYFKAGRPQ
jgi:hypothetical protein